MPHAYAQTLKTFETASGRQGQFYSLPALAKTYPGVARLPMLCSAVHLCSEPVVQL